MSTAGPSASASAKNISSPFCRRISSCSRGRTSTAWEMLLPHWVFAFAGSVVSGWSGMAPGRMSAQGVLRAFRQLPGAVRSRWRARSLAEIDDDEAFRRPQPAWFHDRFGELQKHPERPRVLFVSPYSICPPTHGGGVFMYYALRELSRWCEVHAIVMLDYAAELEANQELRGFCTSVEFIVRVNSRDPHLGSIRPHAVHEFHTPEVEWLLQRQILLHGIDVIQLEYTALGQYARQVRPFGLRAIRTRRLLPVDRARAAVYAQPRGPDESALRIPAGDPVRTRAAAGLRSHSGLHHREQEIPRELPPEACSSH